MTRTKKKFIKPIKKICTDISKKNTFFRNLFRGFLNLKRWIMYKKNMKLPVDNNLVILESYMGRSYACSPRAMYEEMIANPNYKNFRFVWVFKEPGSKTNLLLDNNRTTIVKYGTKEYYKAYATAKYWISNSRIPEHIEKKESQVYIQTWHGTPLKKLGFDIKVEGGNALNTIKDIRNKYETDALRYDYMLSPSSFCTEKFTSAFDLKRLNKENIIVEKGYPRNDFLFKYTNEDVEKIKKSIRIKTNKKIILYAPTWRDDQHTSGVGYTYQLGIDFDKLNEIFGKDYIILFRTHYFVSNSFDFDKYKGFIYDVSQYDDISELYIISDILITDYSSVFFDYANLKRPIIFYMYDLDRYQNKLRDFYFDLSELPGPIVKTEDILIEELNNIDSYFSRYNAKYVEFNNKFNYLDDEKSSERVCEEVIK
jgi:CDP-glycerol glycerophosphotransferase